jgi:ABC-2 type transport system permease protein
VTRGAPSDGRAPSDDRSPSDDRPADDGTTPTSRPEPDGGTATGADLAATRRTGSASLRESYVLARAVAYKSLILRVRYAFNTATNLLTIYVFFALLFFGGRAIAPQAITDSLTGIIVGFFLLLMATVAYSDLSWELIREAQWGTLEQLYMSPLGFRRVVLLKTAVNVLVAFAFGGILLGLMLLTTGTRLALDPLTILPIGLLSLGSAVGVGFLLGGLALVFKRVENVFQIVQFAFVGLVAAPVDSYPLLKALPLTLGADLLRTAMGQGIPLWGLPAADLGLLALKAVAYVAVGYVVFGLFARWARDGGKLGKY